VLHLKTRPRSLILSGGGAYADPWHPFAATSERIAGILAGAGHQVEIAEDVADRLADLRGWDLIAVNAAAGPELASPETGGRGLASPETGGQKEGSTGAARAGLRAALDRGLPVLAVHVGACTLLGLPEWEQVTGAAWVPGTSTHPKVGSGRILTHQDRHPICGPVTDFSLTDERYVQLRIAADVVPFACHQHDGRLHPLLWARTWHNARVVTDLLGHDERSYDSAAHRTLISRAARWLTGDL
jgi:uncharacterized protein